MKVKIGKKIFDSETIPIMIIVSEEEKQLISSMDGTNHKFCSYPENYAPEDIQDFMKG